MPTPAVPTVWMSAKDVKVEWGSGPTIVTFDEQTKVMFDVMDDHEEWHANGNRFVRAMPITKSKRGLTVESGDIYKALGIPGGVPLKITGTILHHKNGAGSGAMTFVCNPCVIKGTPVEAPNQKIATAKVEFMGYSEDDTDPFSFALVT